MPEAELFIKLGTRILSRLRPSKRNALPLPQNPIIHSTAGYKIHTMWYPQQNPHAPTILFCPDYPDTCASFTEQRYPISCPDIYALGYNLLCFDPAGRGKSWGTEDHGGLEHQDNVATLLRWIQQQVPHSKVGVVSMGFGLSMALGGIPASGMDIAFLLDWEGPSDPEFLEHVYTIEKKHIYPTYWQERSPIALLPSCTVPYIRIQSEKDHRTEYDMRHCNRIFRQLVAQQHPHYRLNHHPKGTYPPQPQLLINDREVQKQATTQLLKSLFSLA